MNISYNNEAQQPPDNGILQQLNEWVAINMRNTSSQGSYKKTDESCVGSTQEIGGVLTLTAETYITKRVGYKKFRYFLTNYLVKNFKESMEVENEVKTLNDPLDIFEELNEPDVTKIPPTPGSIE